MASGRKYFPEATSRFCLKSCKIIRYESVAHIQFHQCGRRIPAISIERIGAFLAGVEEVAFVPYAAVTFSYEAYEAKVAARFEQIGVRVRSVHGQSDPREAIRRAQAICVGGGNTFALAKKMQEQGLVREIAEDSVGHALCRMVGGSNVTCPTICTTNDMPIVQPESFDAIGAVKFQINPHYLDANPKGMRARRASNASWSISKPIPTVGWRFARGVYASPARRADGVDRFAPHAHVQKGRERSKSRRATIWAFCCNIINMV